MATPSKCPSCGKPLRPDHSAGDFCPVCLLLAGAKTVPMDEATGSAWTDTKAESVIISGRRKLFSGGGELVSGLRLGHYTLLQKLGQGGFGEVWRAAQSEPVRREVALKLLKPSRGISDEAAARFRAEGQALALMDHPNIARVYDAGQFDDGRLYFAMELVGSTDEDRKWRSGVPLTEYCDARQMGLRERLETFAHVCRAVAGAHQKGIIHRDLKPGNILVGESDGKAVPKVIDFGLAKDITGADALDLTEHTIDLVGTPMGTMQFMAPEQAAGAAVDTRTDVYALGAVLYELLTGSPPLGEEMIRNAAIDEIVRMVREQEAPKPSVRVIALEDPAKTTTATGRLYGDTRRLSSALRGDLDWIALKALEKDPDRRHEGVIQLAEDVEAYVSGNGLPHAAPPSRTYLVKKFVRRHRVSVAAAAAVVLVLIGGVAVSTWQAVRATRAEAATAAQLVETEKQLERSHFEEGKGWLERARGAMDRKENLAAALYAGRSVGYHGFGRDQASGAERELPPSLLGAEMTSNPDLEPERVRLAQRAEEMISKSFPMVYPIWSTPIRSHHRAPITALAFSPDGKVLASASGGPGLMKPVVIAGTGTGAGVVKLWDMASGEELGRMEEHRDDVNCLAFSPDGTILASGSTDRTIIFWERESGNLIRRFQGHLREVKAVGFSPDGTQLVSGSFDNTLRLWDVGSGECVNVLSGHTRGVSDAVFSPDGSKVVSCSSQENTVRVWDAQSGEEIRKFASVQHPSKVAVSPDGQTIIATSATGRKVNLWNAESGEGREGPAQRQLGLRSMALDQSGSVLAAGSKDGTVQLWDFNTWESRGSVEGLGASVGAMAMDPSGERLAAAAGAVIRLWKVGDDGMVALDEEPRGGCELVAYSPDGGRIACASGPHVKVLDATTGAELRSFRVGEYIRGIRGMTFSPDGSKLIILPLYGRIQVCDLATWDVSGLKWDTKLSPSDTSPSAVSEDLNLIAVWARDHSIKVFDRVDGGIRAVCSGHAGRINTVVFNPDGTRIASLSSVDRSLRVWDTETGQEIASTEITGLLSHMTFSPDGRRLAGAGFSLTVWDGESLEELKKIEDEKRHISAFAFSPSGAEIATCRGDGIRLWDADSGEEIASLKGFRGSAMDIAFCPTGTRLVTASRDGTTRLWDVGLRNEVSTLYGHRSQVNMYSSAPERGLITAAVLDNSIRLWDLKTGVELAMLGKHSYMAYGALFTPDAKLILSSSADATLRVWDVESGAPLEVFEAPDSHLNCCAVSPDATRIAVSYQLGGGTHVWERGNKFAWRTLVAPDNLNALWFSADGSRLAGRTFSGVKKVWDLATGAELGADDFNWIEDAVGSEEQIAFKLYRSGLGPVKVTSRHADVRIDLLRGQLDGMVDISGQDILFPGTRRNLTVQKSFSPNTGGVWDLAELTRENLTAEGRLEILLMRDAKSHAGYASIRHRREAVDASIRISDEAHRLYILNLGQQIRIELARPGRDRQVVDLIQNLIGVLKDSDLAADGISVLIHEISAELLLASSEALEPAHTRWISWLQETAPPPWWDAQSRILLAAYDPDLVPEEVSLRLASLYDELLSASPVSRGRLRMAVAVAEGAGRDAPLGLESRLLAQPEATLGDFAIAAYRASKRGERERSLELISRVLADAGDRKDPDHVRIAGLIFINLEADEKALQAFQDAFSLINTRSRIAFDIELGMMAAYWLCEDEEEAIKIYLRFLTARRGGLDWNDPEAVNALRLPARAKQALLEVRLAALENASEATSLTPADNRSGTAARFSGNR